MRPPDRDAVANVLSRASEAAWGRQITTSDGRKGSFPGHNHGGPMYTGLALAVEAWLGSLTETDARAGTEWLLAQQRPDGAFSGTPTAGPPTVDATWAAVAGLQAAGQASAGRAIDRATTWLDGRPPAFVAPILAIRKPAWAPRVPLGWMAIPGALRASWDRFHPWMTLSLVATAAISHALRPDSHHGFFESRAEQAAVALLVRTQNPCGSWTGASLFTLQSVVALRLLGVPYTAGSSEGPIARAMAWFEHWKVRDASGLEVMPFTADVWNTARSLRALLVAGTAVSDPRVATASQWLRSHQIAETLVPEWQNAAGGGRGGGGWAYESTDHVSPDTDTTAAVLAALAPLPGPAEREAVARGRDWLGTLRNADGGWPGFRRGVGTKHPGPLFQQPLSFPESPLAALRMLRSPPAEYQDPSTEDLTGRVMVGLRACGDPEHTLRPAAAFLRAQQWGSRWFGRWDVNYQAGTAYALAGFGAAGVAPDDPAVASAAAWLETRQNTDGGWGEGIETYRAPDAGPAPSRADLTGTVLLGLLGAGRADTPAVHRGVDWLVRAFQPDGTWQGPTPLYIVSPPDEFYSNPVASLAAPIEALGAWLGARG